MGELERLVELAGATAPGIAAAPCKLDFGIFAEIAPMSDAAVRFFYKQNVPEIEDDGGAGFDEHPFVAIFGVGSCAGRAAFAVRPVGHIEPGFAHEIMHEILARGPDVFERCHIAFMSCRR